MALDSARIGIIGTGSTAVQITSAIVDRVERLSLFQRTAQWIMPIDNPMYSEDQKAEYRNDPHLLHEMHANLSLMFDGFSSVVVDADSVQMKFIEEACKANLENGVTDRSFASGCDRTTGGMQHGSSCRRTSPGDRQPNVDLVTAKIERVEDLGVRTSDGKA